MAGAIMEGIRKHHERLDAVAIAKWNVERRFVAASSSDSRNPTAPVFLRLLRAEHAGTLDERAAMPQTDIA